MTSFVGFLPAPGDSIANYDRSLHHDEQPASVPEIFKEIMSVREEVFVKEQGVPLENELDEDDERSFHWVVYASVGISHSSPTTTTTTTTTAIPTTVTRRESSGHNRVGSREAVEEERRNSAGTASRVAVGTIRLVPPPHHAHAHASRHTQEESPTSTARSDSAAAVSHPEPDEPYIKLGRLATLAPYRRLGLSKLLVHAAQDWASDHPTDIVKPLSAADAEAARLEDKNEETGWKGLVVVHAQTQVQGLWERLGFVRNPAMGTWIEEGIEHVGLWKRIDCRKPRIVV